MAAAFGFRPCLQPAWILLLGCALLAPTADSQVRGYPQPGLASPPANYSLSGSVINSVTGDPIRRALVVVADRMQLTDSQGRFEVSGLSAGTFSVTAQKPGFFDESQLESGPDSIAMVTLGPDTAPVVVKLVPEGVIYGRITNQDGEPMEGVSVRARGWRIINGRRQTQEFGGQSTDEDGRFRLFNLMPGTYYVLATNVSGPQGFLPGQVPGAEQGYPTTYFPGVTQLRAASAIELAAGQSAQANFVLHRRPVFQVAGHVTGYSSGRLHIVQLIDPAEQAAALPVPFHPESGSFVARDVAPTRSKPWPWTMPATSCLAKRG